MEQSKMNELVELAKQGDTHAFALLYESIYKDMYRFALYTLRSPDDAEDAVSDAVLDGFYEIGKLRTAEAFRGWMFRILSAKCKRKLKTYINKTVSIEEQEIAAVETDYEENQDLYAALLKLSDKERMIINLSIVAGFQSKEIAKQLHMNSNTVRSVQSRALEKLRRMITV